MSSGDLAFWLCLAANVLLSVAWAAWLTRRVRHGVYAERQAKNLFVALCLATGVFCGAVLFYAAVAWFDVFVGHGEVLIAAPLWNLALSAVLAFVGRVAIGWERMKW